MNKLEEQDMRKLCAVGGIVDQAQMAEELKGCDPRTLAPRIDTVEEKTGEDGRKWRTRYHPYTVMVCPECDADMEEETNRDARTMYHWKCTKCGRKY